MLIGLFISWGVKLFSSTVKNHKIQRLHRVHITVHIIYCLITCNIKSLLNVPKISHISRKTSQVSRFPAKSPDSRNKFVFLPKQPLLELSPLVRLPHLLILSWISRDERRTHLLYLKMNDLSASLDLLAVASIRNVMGERGEDVKKKKENIFMQKKN